MRRLFLLRFAVGGWQAHDTAVSAIVTQIQINIGFYFFGWKPLLFQF